MYPAEYRDYRDHQIFSVIDPGGHGDWEFRLESGMYAGEKRSWQSGDGGFYGIILKRCCRGCRRRCGQDIRWNKGVTECRREMERPFWEWG